MNKSQRIYLSTGDTGNVDFDKHIKIRLEQNVDTLDFLTMSIKSEDVYQNFNSDYGVLVGRVLANGGVGVPNAKISIFIPLSDTDASDSSIYSLYPYKTPREKNNEGKRYNLLPRVSQLDKESGTNKPKQPFGSFPIKPELVINESLLNVYKKYYKYTALTNSYGDYMIFGVPTGTQTVHLSIDITDIGKYSMTPASMIKAGYPANLFTDAGNSIKSSEDLDDLPNIETQEISVDIAPFWGDVENFEIGITQQNFRVKAVLSSDFIIFGTTMTMGIEGIFGNPAINSHNYGFYSLNANNNRVDSFSNNTDIRTYRSVPPIIKVFTYTNDVPVNQLDNSKLVLPTNLNVDKQIRLLDKTEYFEYNVDGNFLLNIPCNRNKIVTSSDGKEIKVDDDSTNGVFTRFYGMILIEYPNLTDLPQNSGWNSKYSDGDSQYKSRGRLKIPQSIGLDWDLNVNDNDKWRKEYYSFTGGGIYSVAQFYPTKAANDAGSARDIHTKINSENVFNGDVKFTGGLWFKTSGSDIITQTDEIDKQNYLIPPATGTTSETGYTFTYDFSPNVKNFTSYPSNTSITNGCKYFGGQWLNLCLTFPQYGWASGQYYNGRNYHFADMYHNRYIGDGDYGVIDNKQIIFAGLSNTKNYLKGDSFQTSFINIPRTELVKLNEIPYKGINVRRWNNVQMDSMVNGNINSLNGEPLTANPYKYLKPKSNYVTVPISERTYGRNYNKYGWDDYYSSYNPIPSDEINASAYLFKGMYGNDCIELLSSFGII